MSPASGLMCPCTCCVGVVAVCGVSLWLASIRASCGARRLHCSHAATAKSAMVWSADRRADLTSCTLQKVSASSSMVVMPMSCKTRGALTPSVEWSVLVRGSKKVGPDPHPTRPPVCTIEPCAGGRAGAGTARSLGWAPAMADNAAFARCNAATPGRATEQAYPLRRGIAGPPEVPGWPTCAGSLHGRA